MNFYKIQCIQHRLILISIGFFLILVCSAFKPASIQKLDDRIIVYGDDDVYHIYYPSDSLYDYFNTISPDSIVNYTSQRELNQEKELNTTSNEDDTTPNNSFSGGIFLFFMLIFLAIYFKFKSFANESANGGNYQAGRFSIKKNSTNRSRIHENPSWFLFASKYDEVLTKYYAFYRSLSVEKRKVFIQRIKEFISIKKFEGRKDLAITQEMKIIVAAVAVQVTFGFKDYLLKNFHLIILYPDEYLSQSTQQYHKGETNAYGAIVFSWKDFVFGIKYDSDNLNLGFHEFAHAVMMSERAYHSNPGFLFYHKQWKDLSNDATIRSKIDSLHLFRRYANANEHEFFAIALENFFETPAVFKQELPELYQTLANMLNQDPLTPNLLINEYEEFELVETE